MAQEWKPRGARRAAEDVPLSGRPTESARPRRLVTPDWDLDDVDDGSAARSGGYAQEAASRLSSLAYVRHSASPQYHSPDPTRPDPSRRFPARGLPPEPDPASRTTPPASWRPVTIDPVPGAARAVEPANMSEKRRREAPALPTTPAPAPEERRDALLAREQSRRQASPAPGTRATDDWQDAPLPAAAVPPPLTGQAPDPIEVTGGGIPQEHQAFVRPADDTETFSPDFAQAAASGLATAQPAPAGESLADRLRRERAAGVSPRLGPARRVHDDDAGPTWPSLNPGGGSSAPPAGSTKRRFPLRLALMALAVVVALGVGAVALVRVLGGTAGASPSSSLSSALLTEADLVTTADLEKVASGWSDPTTETTITTSTTLPLCVTTSTNQPIAQTAMQREVNAGTTVALHRAEGFGSDADATQVYSLRQNQMGQCSNVPVYLLHGARVNGLGDEAVAITAVLQDSNPIYHTVILARTGKVIDTYDIHQPTAPISYDQIAAAAQAALARQCPRSGGACPTTPSAEVGPPPSGGIAGWLTMADLPRITAGVGRWQANEPTANINIAGSGCENLKLADVAGPTSRKQRTYLMQEDPKAPQTFGVDEVTLEFPSAEAAQAFTTQVGQNINGCPNRPGSIAKLGDTGTIDATGAAGVKISGFWRTVRQDTSSTAFLLYRVGVLTVGTKVIYLYGTPSPTYDFSNEAWSQIAIRAGQRATQTG